MTKAVNEKNRAYSVLEVKAVDEDQRVITGIATTPEVDRMGDIVEPLGIKFKNPLPLLWQHRHDQPIGFVKFEKPTKDGIAFEARIPKITEEGTLRNRIEEAWQSVKARLVRGVSIGFRSIEHAFMDDGGIRFLSTEVFELSLVTIPANQSATIQSIKSIDTEQRAALGLRSVNTKPGASGTQSRGNGAMKTVAEQIKDFQAARAAKAAQMEEIMKKASETGETLDAEQSEQYDTLEGEVAALDKHLKRLEALEKAQMVKANSVEVEANRRAAAPASDGSPVRVSMVSKEKGIAFAQYAKCVALGHLFHRSPVEIARARYSDDNRIATLLEKAAVAAATTSHATWAGPLVGDETSVFADFVEFLRPQTILGRFGAGGVPSLRRVPFRTPLIGQTGGGSGYWVGEGKAKPLTNFAFSRTTLEPLKVANIAVATKEVLRDSSPSADAIIRDSLAAALRERMDRDFIDPAKAASAGVSPASILNGLSAVSSSGTDAEAVRCDVKALFEVFIAANNAPTQGVWIMPATVALALSLMQNALGQQEFPGIGMNGGTFFGLPAIVSEYVPSDSNGAVVALVNASDIYLADDGGISIDMSTEASLEMDDAPSHNSDVPAETTLVSLWQTNSVGFLAERTINWSRRRASAAAYLENVLWGSCP